MGDFAKTNGITIKEACQLFEDRGAELAKEMQVSKMQPAVYRALMETP
jgi:hypothetical protein